MGIRLHHLIAMLLILWPAACAAADPSGSIREPAVAGRFYPAEAHRLRAAVEAFLAEAVPDRKERPLALVCPHAGYVFSGQIAADAYRQALGHDYDVIVILGTNHTASPFDGVSVHTGLGYRTPLGICPIDRDLADSLSESHPSFAFRPKVHAREHSVEVQVPFIQVAFPKTPILAAVVGRPDPGLARRFSNALIKALGERRPLIVSSTDLSHYPEYGSAVETDSASLRAIVSMDPSRISKVLAEELRKGPSGLSTCACGEGPILAAVQAARSLGARRGVILSYANSGDTIFGEPDRVVGYGAAAFTAARGGTDADALIPLPTGSGDDPLSKADRTWLLTVARRTLKRYFETGTVPLPRIDSPRLRADQGAFVTLKKRGALRGCIGHMAEDTPLALTVARMALQAALNDRRFRPVTEEELDAIKIEISVLTPLKAVPGPEAVTVGRDGVVIQKGGNRAVFLPHVATEQGWNRNEMLDHLCRKAGLSAGCWRSGTRFQTFQAVVFSESEDH